VVTKTSAIGYKGRGISVLVGALSFSVQRYVNTFTPPQGSSLVSLKRHQKAQQASKQRALRSTRPTTQVLQSPTRLHLLLYPEQFRGLQEQQMATMQDQQQLYNQTQLVQMGASLCLD
jgi:hypothetical protein